MIDKRRLYLALLTGPIVLTVGCHDDPAVVERHEVQDTSHVERSDVVTPSTPTQAPAPAAAVPAMTPAVAPSPASPPAPEPTIIVR